MVSTMILVWALDSIVNALTVDQKHLIRNTASLQGKHLADLACIHYVDKVVRDLQCN